MATSYYVYSEDTGSGTKFIVNTNPNWNGSGVRVGGPFTTAQQAQAFISNGGSMAAFNKTVNTQAAASTGGVTSGWIIVPEGTLGDLTNALAKLGDVATFKSSSDNALIGEIQEFENIANVGSTVANPVTYTTTELTSVAQVELFQDAAASGSTGSGIQSGPQWVIYPTQAAAQAAANQLNQGNQSSNWEQALTNFLDNLTSANMWVRVGKVILGGTLLLIAFAKMTNMDNKVASAAIKAAPFL